MKPDAINRSNQPTPFGPGLVMGAGIWLRRAGCALVFCLWPFLVSGGEIHQWKDEQGNVHFGDKPPPSVETTRIVVKPNVYASPSVERNEISASTDRDVVMYSAEWCGYCKRARKYFTSNGIPFKEYDVERSRKGRRDYKKLKAKGVPVILVGEQRLNGFSETSFKSIYDAVIPGA